MDQNEVLKASIVCSRRLRIDFRLLVVASLCLCAVACDPIDTAEIVVAPRPAVRSDSAARAAFRRSALEVVDRVSRREGLVHFTPGPTDPRSGQECFGQGTFEVCAGERDSAFRLIFREWAVFTDESKRIRKTITDSLRTTFGNAVHDCVPKRLRFSCRPLAQVDSAR